MVLRSRLIHQLVNNTPIKDLLSNNRFAVRAYFNALYTQQDPYNLSEQAEVDKIQKAFGLVGSFRATKALEIGCGEGRRTHYVAGMAEKETAIDISDRAIKRATQLHQGDPQIEYRRVDLVTARFHGEEYDFIVCSEVLYYLSAQQLTDVVDKIISLLKPSGKLLLVHIRSLKDDTSGLELKEFGAKTIHEAFHARPQLKLEAEILDINYRISLFGRLQLESCSKDSSESFK